MRGIHSVAFALLLAACAPPAVRGGSADAAIDAGFADAGAESDAGSSDDAGSGPAYVTCPYIGALDRIGIWRRDEATGDCAFLGLVSPGGTWDYLAELDLPTNWGVERARFGRPEHCDCSADRWFDGAEAIAGSGFVTFDVPDGGYWPRSLTIDATLTFDGGSQVRFEAEDLPVMP